MIYFILNNRNHEIDRNQIIAHGYLFSNSTNDTLKLTTDNTNLP